MKNSLLFLFAGLVLISCTSNRFQQDNSKVFTKELLDLKEFYSIPGLSAIITRDNKIVYERYFGYADLDTNIRVDSSTAFPIASITKLFSATLLMKLVETGKISLNDPVVQFLPASKLNDSIRVKHILSHTSQGNIGKQFFYSSRFGLLTEIIKKATDKPFKELMENKIFKQLDLQNTFLLEDSLQLAYKNKKIAAPYFLEKGIQKGFIDYGYSASAGVVSTPRDLIQFSHALDLNTLITKESKNTMFHGIANELPYAYGVFKQKIQKLDVLWVYGQYDCYSSLLLKVPSKNLTLVLLANNNLMSDPARLIMGDVFSSLFAISFLKNYVFDLSEMPLIEKPNSVYMSEFSGNLYTRKVLAQALAESFMARFKPEKMNESAELLERTFEMYPNYLSYSNINLLHNLIFLKDVAFHMDLGEFKKFDVQIEKIGQKLLAETPNNPYVHSYMGNFFDKLGNKEKARFHYKTIIDLNNFSPNWYTNEARIWLKENP